MFEFITKRSIWWNLLAGFIIMVLILFLLSVLLGPVTRHNKNKTVPNVVGKSLAEPRKIRDKSGFEVEVQDSIYTDTPAQGSVLRQIPEGVNPVKISGTFYWTVNRHVRP